ncbi:MAG: hypothetical protein Q4D55_03885 [Eubacteriales bacterium]|nr:hypothetical protein [Eubacteriales bacterium]
MKKSLYTAACLLLLSFLLLFPSEALAAARDGMSLWLNTLVPVLLPFLILTGILVHTGQVEKLLSPLSRLWRSLFGLSPWGVYVFLLGSFCGCPMGPKLARDLCVQGRLSKREASYLLTFTGSPSPVFLITYLGGVCLKGRVSPFVILGLLLSSNLLTMVFFRFFVFRNKTWDPAEEFFPKKETPAKGSTGAILDVSIMNGFETITRLGGYILLFSILSAAVSHFWPFSLLGKCVLLGFLELTTGLHQLSAALLSPWQTWFLSMVMAAFGGFCIMAQTKSVLDGDLSIIPYASAKCVNALFMAVLLLMTV